MAKREAWQVADDAAVLYEKSFVPAIFARSAVILVEVAQIGRGDHVLDVGCGTGIVAREAARRIGAEGRVVGLDLNPRMLEVARRVAPEIEWRQGDAADLPFEDGAFDVVASQYAAMFFPDPVLALREMWRVVAARGRLAVAVCGPLAKTPGYGALAQVAEGICDPQVVALLKSPFALGDEGVLEELVRTSEIDGAAVQTVQCPVRFPSIEALVHTEVMASPIRDVIDQGSYQALLKAALARLADLSADGAGVSFEMPVRIVVARKP